MTTTHCPPGTRRRRPAPDHVQIELGGTSPEVTVIHVRGELDRAGVPALARWLEPLLDAGPRCAALVVDLSATTFLDAGGVNLLLDAQRRADAGGTVLALAGCSRQVMRTLEVTGTAELLRLLPAHRAGSERGWTAAGPTRSTRRR